MRKTPETIVKEAIDQVLDQFAPYVWYRKTARLTMGKPLLDYHGHCCGRAFAIEAKQAGAHPTKQQEGTLDEIALADGEAFVISGPEGMIVLEAWLLDTLLKANDDSGQTHA
jgi:hypothetical protein